MVSPLEDDVRTPEEAVAAVRLATGAAVGGAILDEGGCLPDVPEEEDIVGVVWGKGRWNEAASSKRQHNLAR